MKITEGTYSDIPSKPSTGYVGLLAKHRKTLDPSFNVRSEQKKLHSYARALIEALGGKQTADGWSVDLGSAADISARVDAVAADVANLREAIAGIAEALAAVQVCAEQLAQQVQQTQEDAKGIETLATRVAVLEQAEAKRVEDSGAKKRPTEKAEKAG